MQRFFFFSSLNLKQFNCNSIKMYVIIYFMSFMDERKIQEIKETHEDKYFSFSFFCLLRP